MHDISRTTIALMLASCLALSGCGPSPAAPVEAGKTQAPAYPKGPHDGRLLTDGNVSVELLIFEAPELPPRLHVYATADGQPVAPSAVQLAVELKRLGGRVDRLDFKPDGDHLTSQGAVEEPHSFDVTVIATIAGKSHRWTYASHEGRLHLSAADARAKGVAIEKAGPATLHASRDVGGAIVATPAPAMQFNINKIDFADIRAGLPIEIFAIDGRSLGRSTITSVKPPAEEGSRATVITVAMTAQAAGLPVGTPLKGRVEIGSFAVPVAVRTVALQHFRTFRVVMAKYGEDYEVRMLELGRQTPEWTEVKSGLEPGTPYVAANAFALGQKLDKNQLAIHVAH